MRKVINAITNKLDSFKVFTTKLILIQNHNKIINLNKKNNLIKYKNNASKLIHRLSWHKTKESKRNLHQKLDLPKK